MLATLFGFRAVLLFALALYVVAIVFLPRSSSAG